MKKNNIILAIVLIAFVICVALVLYFRLNPKEEEEAINIDLNSLAENINSNTEFGEMTMQNVDKVSLKETFDIEEEKVEEVIGKIPFINVHSSMYIIVKANAGETEYIRGKLEEYGLNYEAQWEKYLPEQYELVKKRKIGVKGDYVYFIVSDSADEIVEMIK
ncbi:MAG: DUF4358 domain-containing protein [Clostridia bacterium]|nr:DUF4358 domain-containing protein [Clostridia bacterium]